MQACICQATDGLDALVNRLGIDPEGLIDSCTPAMGHEVLKG